MSDEQVTNISNSDQTVSSYAQQFVEELGEQWQEIHDLTPEDLKQILLALPDKYKSMTIQVVAENIINSMKLHLLHSAAIFYCQAEDEGIDARERDATLQNVKADICSVMQLDQRLSIHTYKDLYRLGTITVNAQGLGESDTAEDAQHWLYNLPTIYQDTLRREHLTKPTSGELHR